MVEKMSNGDDELIVSEHQLDADPSLSALGRHQVERHHLVSGRRSSKEVNFETDEKNLRRTIFCTEQNSEPWSTETVYYTSMTDTVRDLSLSI